MPEIVLLSGSLRQGSLNTTLARSLADLAPADCRCRVVTPADIPLYDGDREAADGVPGVVDALKDRVAAADGLVLVTPEYNHGVPGVLKNAIDWMSRPPADIGRVFRQRPAALCGATPGRGGTRMAQAALLPTLRSLGMQLWTGGSLFLDGARNAFDSNGAWTDDDQRARAERFIGDFSRWAASHGPAASA